MLDVISWLIVAEVIGLAAFPFAYAAFPNLPDRAWGFAKPIGLIVIGTAVWGLSQVGVLPNAPWAWWVAISALALASGLFAYRRRDEMLGFFRRNWTAVAIGETVFITFFVAWTLFRVFDPNIAGTEKPMDFMFLNASVATPSAPPEDPWLSGEPVAYYYFGYWMFGGLAKAGGIAPGIAYNLALSLSAAMAAGAIFTLVYSLVRRESGSAISAVWAGMAGAALLLVVSSLAGWWELLANFGVGTDGFYNWLAIDGLERNPDSESWRPTGFWWWWRASRVINTFNESGAGLDFTIQEFPLFSFLLGDLHPHVMSIPFVLVGLGAVYNIFASKIAWGFGWIRRNPASAVSLVVLIGVAGFINAWDAAFLAMALIAAVTLKTYGEKQRSLAMVVGTGACLAIALTVAFAWWMALAVVSLYAIGLLATYRVRPVSLVWSAATAGFPLAALAAIGLFVFSPFYFGTLATQVQMPPIAPADYGTRPVHFLTVWGLFLLLSAAFLLLALFSEFKYRISRLWKAISGSLQWFGGPEIEAWLLGIVSVVLPYVVWAFAHLEFTEGARPADLLLRLWTAAPLSLIVVLLFVALVSRARAGIFDAVQFALMLILMAMYLLFGAELLHVNDFFGNRMNTVFKFYYQCWILLSVACAFGLWRWRSHHLKLTGWRHAASGIGASVAIILLAGALYYSVAATFTKAKESGASTIDGISYLEKTAPAELAAIEFLRGAAEPGDRLVEAVGGSYTEFGRISGSTGVPTVLGWPGHERQWRGSGDLVAPREADVRELYETEDQETASGLITAYGLDFVVVGDRERSQYPLLHEGKFDTLGSRVFEVDDLVIYCVKENCP